ncbi:MAG: NTP transferase domain-containing protein, partial [Gemmatimonadota bacterium]|nr:NTP transferase domain-containing protein [Gemmatimonadota bacterium]
MAAGGSTRFGSPKQLAEKDGETLVHRAAMAAKSAGADPVFVVLGAAADEIAPELDGI